MITSAESGERVTYSGNDAGMRGLPGTVVRLSGNQCKEGCPRYLINFGGAMVLDMCVTVLTKEDTEGSEVMAKARKTVVTHPDGTQSARNSVNNIYIYAVEAREDRWEMAKLHREQAQAKRDEKARFIAAVRAGRISVKHDSKFFDSVYLLGEGGESWWLGGDDHASAELNREAKPLDRKTAVRRMLQSFDDMAAVFEREARKEESGPQYAYGVLRWSMSHDGATKGLREFEGRTATTCRVVPAEAAE